MVGTFAYGIALTSPILTLTNLQLRGIQATDAREQFGFEDYLSLRLLTCVVFVIVSMVIVQLATTSATVSMVVWLIAVTKATDSVSDVLYGRLQHCEQMRSIAISMLVKAVASCSAVAASVAIFGDLTAACAAMMLVSIGVLVGYDIPCTRTIPTGESSTLTVPIRQRFHNIVHLLQVSAPLGVVMCLLSLSGNIPRYYLERVATVETLGIFAAAASLSAIGGLIITSVGQSAAPRLAAAFVAGRQNEFINLSKTLMYVAAAAAVGGIAISSVWGDVLLAVAFEAEYSKAKGAFVILMAASGMLHLASLSGFALTAAARFGVQVVITIVSIAITVGVCLLCTRLPPLEQASVAVLAGATTQSIGNVAALAKAVRMQTAKSTLGYTFAQRMRSNE
jgi:O-antigen/teichoic acid export membrane protein